MARRRRTIAPSCVRAASSLNSVAVRSKRVISIGLFIVVLPANRRDTQRESYSGRFGNRPPEEESIFSAAGISRIMCFEGSAVQVYQYVPDEILEGVPSGIVDGNCQDFCVRGVDGFPRTGRLTVSGGHPGLQALDGFQAGESHFEIA